MTAAQSTVKAERLAARRIDERAAALDRRWLRWPVLRSAVRNELSGDLRHLVDQHPGLRADPAVREERWAAILRQAQSAEQQHLNDISRQIDQAVDNIDEHAAIANRARTAAHDRAQIYGRLSAELDRRTSPHETRISQTPPAGSHSVAKATTPATAATETPEVVLHDQLELRIASATEPVIQV